ncbi:MAG: 2-oxoglutarate and iron-dependent oxygenase domain-containing protein [Alphaproteobacteria bacterium]
MVSQTAVAGAVDGASTREVPVVDIAGLRSEDPADRQAVAREIDRACRGIGFLYVTNHGVPDRLVGDLEATARRFFALPLDDKMAIASERSEHFRGYVPLQSEAHNPGRGRDLHGRSTSAASRGAARRRPSWPPASTVPTSGRRPCRICGRSSSATTPPCST